jgi:hypothetical protein
MAENDKQGALSASIQSSGTDSRFTQNDDELSLIDILIVLANHKDANNDSMYLVKADGSVVSKRQSGSVFGSFNGQKMMPGDAIVVPEDFDKFCWTKELRDWSQIFISVRAAGCGTESAR